MADEVQTETEGMRTRRALMLKQFIPSPDFISREIVAKGKGTEMWLARVYGVATGAERKNNTVGDKVIQSIVLRGVFQGESYLTGEVTEATTVYLPMAYAEKVAMLFDKEEADAKAEERLVSPLAVEIDCDVGIEATGKTIPYAWSVMAYNDGRELAALKRIRQLRGRPANAPALKKPEGDGAKQIEHKGGGGKKAA